MKKVRSLTIVSAIVFLVLGLCFTVYASKPTTVEVLYMNHGPLKETINKMKNLFTQYGAKVNVSWYDFDSPEGEKFMAKKGVKQHVPLVVWIDGSAGRLDGGQKNAVHRFSQWLGPCLLPRQMDHGRLEGCPRPGYSQTVRMP